MCKLASHCTHTHAFSLQAKVRNARWERLIYLLLEPLGVLGYEVSHLPEPPEPNSSDRYTSTRVGDETNFEKKEVVHNFLLHFRTGSGTPSSSSCEAGGCKTIVTAKQRPLLRYMILQAFKFE